MILYEMYEQKVPFGGFDRMRIYKMVVEDRQRPELHAPDSPIGILIQQCWAHKAQERPTFETIYAQFASHSVYFPGTKQPGTAALIHEVHQEETIVHTAVVNVVRELNAMVALRRAKKNHAEIHAALTKCAENGDICGMNALLTAYITNININEGDANGVKPLHAAVRAGQIVAVEFIVKIKKADKNVRDAEGNTPLIAAVKWGQERIVGLLVQCKGVDVNLQNKYGWTALHVVALLDETWHQPMLEMLAFAGKELRVDLEDREGKKPFWNAPDVISELQSTLETVVTKKY
jgi:hypothetical protein